jgi:uncharacterized protein (DUF983 family)
MTLIRPSASVCHACGLEYTPASVSGGDACLIFIFPGIALLYGLYLVGKPDHRHKGSNIAFWAIVFMIIAFIILFAVYQDVQSQMQYERTMEELNQQIQQLEDLARIYGAN